MEEKSLASMRNKRGFTIIELLVVIAIIGLLSAVVLASLNTARAKARNAERQSDIHQIFLALTQYNIDKDGFPVITPAVACLGVPSGTSCWAGYGVNGGGFATIQGNTTLNTLLAPYIPTIPKDPQPTRSYGDAYVYFTGPGDVHCNGTETVVGTWIAWEPDDPNPTTDAQCAPGKVACCSYIGCSPTLFCLYKVD
jgi:prepilin-type N-terminal cleavage/methylation domain-containing protein